MPSASKRQIFSPLAPAVWQAAAQSEDLGDPSGRVGRISYRAGSVSLRPDSAGAWTRVDTTGARSAVTVHGGTAEVTGAKASS